MNWELITAVVFYSIVAILIYINRDKFQWMQKVFLVHKTQKGLKWMKKLSRFTIFWKIFSTLAIPTAVFCALWVGQMLWSNSMGIIAGTAGAGVYPAIPGVRIPGSPFYIPFWQGIIAIALLAVVHEFAHGIVASMEGLKLKSTGFGFLAILPLAFVEIDEDNLRNAPRLSRLRVAASGAFANIWMWVIFSLLIGFIFGGFVSSSFVNEGINITATQEGLPADIAGVPAGSIIYGINNYSTPTMQDFQNIMNRHKAGEIVVLNTSEGIFEVETVSSPQDPDAPLLGVMVMQDVRVADHAYEKYGRFGFSVIMWMLDLFKWIALLNLFVGIMNFLPIWALDGGMIFYDLTSYVFKSQKLHHFVVTAVFAFFLILLLFNLLGPAILSLF